jgi:hypothetical protein
MLAIWQFQAGMKIIQAALVIRGFGIRGFDYSRFGFCNQNLLFAVFPSIIRGLRLIQSLFFNFLNIKIYWSK